MKRWSYWARILPIATPVRIPNIDGSRGVVTSYEGDAFNAEQNSPHHTKVLLDHDRAHRISQLKRLYERAGWWWCEFDVDPTLDLEFDVGQPVSVGLSEWKWGSTTLDEISIVPRGAVKGAQIMNRRFEWEKPSPEKPSPPAPAPEPARRSPEVVEVIDHGDDGPIVWRNHPDPELAELHRRMDYVETTTGRPADPETVLIGMRIEREGTNALLRLSGEYFDRQRQPRLRAVA